MAVIEFAQLLYDSELGTALRESVVVFPFVEGLHLIGLTLSVGLLLFVDLRLLGVFLTQIPVANIIMPLRPWLLSGFSLTFITGVFLFIAAAVKVIVLPVFLFKLAFIALAGINALWFELRWGKSVTIWGEYSVLPVKVKVAGFASLFLWSLVIITGRLIPYFGIE